MRVGLIGFGKTGKAVATQILKNSEITLEWVVRKKELLEHRSVPEYLGIESTEPGHIYSTGKYKIIQLLEDHPVDAIIDFSSENGIDYYGEEAAKRSIIIVTAISNYSLSKQKKLKSLSKLTPVLWSPNITIGINFLIIAAQTLKNISPETDIEIIEEHFKTKNEISGTAKIIANELDIKESDIKSIRAGGIIGTHQILFGFPFQTVRMQHESISREAFGDGAMFAATKLRYLEPGLYNMRDLLIPYFEKEKDSVSVWKSIKNILIQKFKSK